ncbi:halocyanin domain-containing protein [Halorubrum trueperi]|uniref:Halocyanin domain-containing protein n=1 Tax=Halorubrum trueperi TaxID=2004704 RepID=A0ABD5URX8_9EURY
MRSNADDMTMSRRGLFRASAAGAAVAAGVAAGSGSVVAQYDGWLDDVDNYDGTHDYTGQDEVTVEVGAVDGLKFGPAAILIDPGTTVVWEWTGEGGGHNVVATDETFDSGDPVEEAGTTFEYTFEDVVEGDTFNYSCTPHEAAGMKGSIAIGEVDDDLVTPGEGGGGDGGDGEDGGADGDASDGGSGGRDLSTGDIGALALGFGLAGALLVPLFYAAHKMANEDA